MKLTQGDILWIDLNSTKRSNGQAEATLKPEEKSFLIEVSRVTHVLLSSC